MTHNLPKGSIELGNKEVFEASGSKDLPAYTLSIKSIAAKTSSKNRLLLRADDPDSYRKWLEALEAAINGELPPTSREVTLDK